MKMFNKMKSDSKIIIQNLKETNETLLNTLIDYQDIIFEQRETIDCQSKEIERLQRRNLELQHQNLSCHSDAIKEFAERLCDDRVSNDPVVIAVKCELKEMVGDGDA